MDIKTIQKYSKKTTPQLLNLATKHFNKFIRERDLDKPCVSCYTYTTLQAGHFYSGGHYPPLKFNENNVNGQCVRCNMHLHGNLIEYRLNLIDRIGLEKVEQLDFTVKMYKRCGHKWDRISIIEKIEKYKSLNNLK